MKKVLCVILAALATLSVSSPVFASNVNDYTAGTDVVYSENAAETYTVMVPAVMIPGQTAVVTASGTWNSNRKLCVSSDNVVILTSLENSENTQTLDVIFEGIEKEGSNTEAVFDTKEITVADMGAGIYGGWEGLFSYNIEIVDVVQTTAEEQGGLNHD